MSGPSVVGAPAARANAVAPVAEDDSRVSLSVDLLHQLRVLLGDALGVALGSQANPIRSKAVIDPAVPQPVSGNLYEISGAVVDEAGNVLTVKRAFANVLASQTDSQVVAAVALKKIRVLSVAMVCGSTPTTITFNSKGGGAGSAISMSFANAANHWEILPRHVDGWFETAAGEALTVTTSAGSTTGVQLTYVEA